jgi:hypothetical protein
VSLCEHLDIAQCFFGPLPKLTVSREALESRNGVSVNTAVNSSDMADACHRKAMQFALLGIL